MTSYNQTHSMFSLPPDIFGLILTDLAAAHAFAATCWAARKVVKSLFKIICYEDGDVAIKSPSGPWRILNDGRVITPQYTHSALSINLLDCSDTELYELLVENIDNLGVACMLTSMHELLIYDRSEEFELKYFSQYIELLGPIKCIWVGDADEWPIGRIGKFRVSIYDDFCCAKMNLCGRNILCSHCHRIFSGSF